MILQNSSGVGGMPIAINPHPITSNPSANNKAPIIINAATNFALIIQSRWIGCASIRLSVPLFCSELTASKPSAIPSKGPKKLMKRTNEGSVPSDTVKSFKKRNEPSGSSGFIAAPILVRAVYKAPMQVNTMMLIKMIKRRLCT